MAVLADFFQYCVLAEAGHVSVIAHTFPAPPGMVCIGDMGDVFIGEFAMRAIHHPAHLAGVDEEHLAPAVTKFARFAVAGEKPQAGRNLGRVEELSR